ncbi:MULTISPECIES: S1 family peptidase [unclassified Streptomyces]|uniref:S1 family peptidase n=1 Tax=unclassified Streptomyces TaxID=2593676 RepID=UPI002034A6B4|nr:MULTISPECIES: S1 family peptidase [unclassified Streptomyces]MCM2417260.1 S1 family peptidase [Streptomyces sp. RKAG293]MCM2430514.1 S1 family peptidase [Streptomyces sp. RKAG337]
MKHRRITRRRIAIAGTSAAAVVAAGVLLPHANAAQPTAPSPKAFAPAAAAQLAGDLTSRLGDRTAGSYYDAKTKQLVVNVLDATADQKVQDAGAVARTVQHTMAELHRSAQTLGAQPRIPGTAWSIDSRTNQVVVTADSTVKGAQLDSLTKSVKALGGTAQLHRSAGRFKPFVAGGDAIFADGARCSLGFNVVKDGQPYFLTAGHCGVAFKSWSGSSGGQEIGNVEAATFPGHDFALVKYTDTSVAHPSSVDLYNGSTQAITKAGDPTVGQTVQRSGSTTQVHDGTVTGLDATVNYQEGSVTGLIQTNVCAEPGDSGGALFSGDTAVGLTSGGSGDCTNGGETFFQPVTAALTEYGAQIG